MFGGGYCCLPELHQARDIRPREKRDKKYLGILGQLRSIRGVPRTGDAQQSLWQTQHGRVRRERIYLDSKQEPKSSNRPLQLRQPIFREPAPMTEGRPTLKDTGRYSNPQHYLSDESNLPVRYPFLFVFWPFPFLSFRRGTTNTSGVNHVQTDPGIGPDMKQC